MDTKKHHIIDKYFNKNRGFGRFKPIAVSLLKSCVKLLDTLGVDYFAISGTLLGFVRHNDFIPWDDDMDLIVDIKIKELIKDKLEEIKNNPKFSDLHIINLDYMLKICYKNKGCPINYEQMKEKSEGNIYNFPFVDLFFFNNDNTDKIHFFHKDWPREHFYPENIFRMEDFEIKIPKNPKYFLDVNYGATWETHFVSSNYSHRTEQRIKKPHKITRNDYLKFYEKH